MHHWLKYFDEKLTRNSIDFLKIYYLQFSKTYLFGYVFGIKVITIKHLTNIKLKIIKEKLK